MLQLPDFELSFAGPLIEGVRVFHLVRPGSDESRQLFHGVLGLGPVLEWSPDGAKIAFSTRVSTGGSRRFDIYLIDLEAVELTNLTPSICCWSPMGPSGSRRWQATYRLDWYHLKRAFHRTFPGHSKLVSRLRQALYRGEGNRVVQLVRTAQGARPGRLADGSSRLSSRSRGETDYPTHTWGQKANSRTLKIATASPRFK